MLLSFICFLPLFLLRWANLDHSEPYSSKLQVVSRKERFVLVPYDFPDLPLPHHGEVLPFPTLKLEQMISFPFPVNCIGFSKEVYSHVLSYGKVVEVL
jgi:hypothetical protein